MVPLMKFPHGVPAAPMIVTMSERPIFIFSSCRMMSSFMAL